MQKSRNMDYLCSWHRTWKWYETNVCFIDRFHVETVSKGRNTDVNIKGRTFNCIKEGSLFRKRNLTFNRFLGLS